MPRLAKNEKEKFCNKIPGEIAKHCKNNHVGIKEATAKFGMTYGTFNNRCNDPGKFTLRELLDIASYFNVSLFTLLGHENY